MDIENLFRAAESDPENPEYIVPLIQKLDRAGESILDYPNFANQALSLGLKPLLLGSLQIYMDRWLASDSKDFKALFSAINNAGCSLFQFPEVFYTWLPGSEDTYEEEERYGRSYVNTVSHPPNFIIPYSYDEDEEYTEVFRPGLNGELLKNQIVKLFELSLALNSEETFPNTEQSVMNDVYTSWNKYPGWLHEAISSYLDLNELWKPIRNAGWDKCNCENMNCQYCAIPEKDFISGCWNMADKNSFISDLGNFCKWCIEYMPLHYHSAGDAAIYCHCVFCKDLDAYAVNRAFNLYVKDNPYIFIDEGDSRVRYRRDQRTYDFIYDPKNREKCSKDPTRCGNVLKDFQTKKPNFPVEVKVWISEDAINNLYYLVREQLGLKEDISEDINAFAVNKLVQRPVDNWFSTDFKPNNFIASISNEYSIDMLDWAPTTKFIRKLGAIKLKKPEIAIWVNDLGQPGSASDLPSERIVNGKKFYKGWARVFVKGWPGWKEFPIFKKASSEKG